MKFKITFTTAAKQEKVFMEACCFAAVVNVVLNYILIPYGGASAAAFTSGISAIVICVWLFVKKDSRVKLNYAWEVCKGPLIGSLLIVLFCVVVKIMLSNLLSKIIISICGSVLLYFLALLLSHNELVIEVYRTVMKKIRKM